MKEVPYIRTATEDLQRAITAIEAEIADIRAQINRDESDRRNKQNELERRINIDNFAAGSSQTGAGEQRQFTQDAIRAETDKSNVNQEFSRLRQQRDNDIRAKQDAIQGLRDMITGLRDYL